MLVFTAILIIAVIFTLLASFGHRDKSLQTLSVLFLLLFFPLWAFSLWIPALGPVWNGIAFFDFLGLAIILTAFIYSVSTVAHRNNRPIPLTAWSNYEDELQNLKRSYNVAFFLFIAFMILAIIIGHIKTLP